jgi:hypothetical protein
MERIVTFPASASLTYLTIYSFAAFIVVSIFSYGLYLVIRELHDASVSKATSKPGRVAILVLGDVGRSPRMQNHAVSFAKAGCQVDLIGFRGQFLVPHSSHGRCRIVRRCHGFERQDPPALLTLNAQVHDTWWEGVIRAVWAFQSYFSNIFASSNFVLCAQALLHSCPGTLTICLNNRRILPQSLPLSLQNLSALFVELDLLSIGTISDILS